MASGVVPGKVKNYFVRNIAVGRCRPKQAFHSIPLDTGNFVVVTLLGFAIDLAAGENLAFTMRRIWRNPHAP